ncbi:MAG TPA: WecB/TagA/CpsF family glycosyltransferase [Cyclobacteriaceae bacterium]|nr:WecB/TagA/CpsF family glycosyltransferase [Cyclobacteriaceae bacterium]
MERINIFGSVITLGSYSAFLDRIIQLAGQRIPSYVCFANVHMIVEANRDPSLRRAINQATLVAPDGKPLSVFMKTFHRVEQERVCGMDILPDLLRKAQESGRSVYFYGGEQHCLDLIQARAKKDFPKLRIAGLYSPPYRQLTAEEKAEDLDRIRNSGADLVFVSLGCPRQEKWMAESVKKLNACFLGLGQAFTVYAQLERRLPKWMRTLCLEWAFRLFQEPGRLWKRYLYTNSEFLLMTMKYAISPKQEFKVRQEVRM